MNYKSVIAFLATNHQKDWAISDILKITGYNNYTPEVLARLKDMGYDVQKSNYSVDWYDSKRAPDREYGPATENIHGGTEWFRNGVRHRTDGPAEEGHSGTKFWYLNGREHREDGPAQEFPDGEKQWWIHGQRHREDGPAVMYPNGKNEWYLNGKNYTQADYDKLSDAEKVALRPAPRKGVRYAFLATKQQETWGKSTSSWILANEGLGGKTQPVWTDEFVEKVGLTSNTARYTTEYCVQIESVQKYPQITLMGSTRDVFDPEPINAWLFYYNIDTNMFVWIPISREFRLMEYIDAILKHIDSSFSQVKTSKVEKINVEEL